MSKSELDHAADLIRAQHYEEAHKILKRLAKNNPTAQQWLVQLYQVAPHLETQRRSFGFPVIVGALVGMCLLGCICITVYAALSGDSDIFETTDDATQEPQITTSEGEVINIPGTAFMDGRDPVANPPLTIMSINIWDKADRGRVVCRLNHGSEVDVRETTFNSSEDRYYIRVSGDDCSGWVSDPFISAAYHAPIGDQISSN